MPDSNCYEAFDLNALPDPKPKEQLPVAEDADDIDFGNYKGIYANDDANQKYQCPETGAHFEPGDLCCRLKKVMEKRKILDQQIYGKQQQQQEIFSSSIMSE